LLVLKRIWKNQDCSIIANETLWLTFGIPYEGALVGLNVEIKTIIFFQYSHVRLWRGFIFISFFPIFVIFFHQYFHSLLYLKQQPFSCKYSSICNTTVLQRHSKNAVYSDVILHYTLLLMPSIHRCCDRKIVQSY